MLVHRDSMNIDVVVLTKNSKHILEQCLNSIYRNVPINKLIVIDGFSTDSTQRILQEFNRKYGNLRIIEESGTRATARELGIENVETDWFLFVDSDVILCKDWYIKASKYMKNDVGAIWGLTLDFIHNVHNRTFYKLFTHVTKEAFKVRGGMHDTLIQRKAVEKIKIPQYLHTYEDSFIINWIKRQGYKIITKDDVYCLHIRPPEDWNIKESILLARQEIVNGLARSKAFKYILYYPIFFVYWLLQRSSRYLVVHYIHEKNKRYNAKKVQIFKIRV